MSHRLAAIPLCAVFTFASFLSEPARAAEPNANTSGATTGTLFIVGGGSLPEALGLHFLDLAGGANARIVVIPTASSRADQPGAVQTYTYFKSTKAKSVELLHTRDRKKADEPEFVKPLNEATAVWLTGGDQSRLSTTYHGTAVEKALIQLLARGGVIGGTSAGAAVMSSVMIVGGTVEAEVGTGFGLLGGVVIDQHFQNRNRLHRLLGVLAKYPECPGVGIDEETALVVRGRTATVEGNGSVWACLCARGSVQASVQAFKNGEKLDLAALQKTASARRNLKVEAKPPAPTSDRVFSEAMK